MNPEIEDKIAILRARTLSSNWNQVALAAFFLPLLVTYLYDSPWVNYWYGLYLFGGGFLLFRTRIASQKLIRDPSAKTAKDLESTWAFHSVYFASMWAILCWLPFEFTSDSSSFLAWSQLEWPQETLFLLPPTPRWLWPMPPSFSAPLSYAYCFCPYKGLSPLHSWSLFITFWWSKCRGKPINSLWIVSAWWTT